MTVTLASLRDEGLWTGTALRLPVGTTPEEATEIGATLGDLHDSMQWAVGDYIIDCEKLFGETAYQIIESLRLSEERRHQYVRVSLAFPPERRREVTWSHHRAVAALPPVAADRLLWQAERGRWTKYQLESEKREQYEPKFRINSRLLVEVAEAIVEDARPWDDGHMTVDSFLIEKMGRLLGK